MEGMPNIGDQVKWQDPWFYNGTGKVVGLQTQPHLAVQVLIETVEDKNNRRWIGRKTWVLPGHVEIIAPGGNQEPGT